MRSPPPPPPPGYGHCGDQVNPESRSGESAQGESRLVWLVSYARWYKAQSLYTKQRFAKGVQRNITDFLKASITTDSIKIFSITFCTLVTVYCTYKISSERRFQNCALRYNFSHVALRCSSFRVKTVVCLQQRCTMLYATERQRLRAVNY